MKYNYVMPELNQLAEDMQGEWPSEGTEGLVEKINEKVKKMLELTGDDGIHLILRSGLEEAEFGGSQSEIRGEAVSFALDVLENEFTAILEKTDETRND